MKIQTIILVSALFISSCSQTAYLWRNDDGNEINATWLAEIDEPVGYDGSGNIRLRLHFDFGEDISITKNNDDEQASGEARNILVWTFIRLIYPSDHISLLLIYHHPWSTPS